MVVLNCAGELPKDKSSGDSRRAASKTQWVCFLGTAVLFVAYAVRYSTPPLFGGDAEHYWHLGQTFVAAGQFSLLEGEQTFRGYLFPAFLSIIQYFGKQTGTNPFHLFFAINAVLTAYVLVLLLPKLTSSLFDARITKTGVLLFIALFMIFWRGYLVEPLTDTWSLFLILAAAAALVQLSDSSLVRVAAFACLSGSCLAAAINLRPIYLVCAPAYTAAIFLFARDRRAMFVGLLTSTVGAATVLWPQSSINQHFMDTINPFVHSGSLYVQQIFFGLAVQRHECAYFADPSGIELLQRAGISFFAPRPNGELLFVQDMSALSLRKYIMIAIDRPLDVTAIYVRHLVNGLALLGSNIYACTLQEPRRFLNLGSMAIAMLATIVAFFAPAKVVSRRYHLLIWPPLVSVLLTIPTAMEGRFFLPIHLFAYAFLCFLTPWRDLARRRRQVTALAALLAVILLLSGTVLSSTYSSALAWLGSDAQGVRLKPSPALYQP